MEAHQQATEDHDFTSHPHVRSITNMKDLEEFTGAHKRCLVMMSMKGCLACNLAVPHIVAAAEKYQKKIWIAYLDVNVVGIKASTVPIFQGFFNGYRVGELVDRGYSTEALNDLIERLWLTKSKSKSKTLEKTSEEKQ